MKKHSDYDNNKRPKYFSLKQSLLRIDGK